MIIRKIHRTIGIIWAPFFLLTASTGILLLFRNIGLYSIETLKILIGLHNWEIVANYVGIILAIGLISMAISGILLFLQIQMRKWQG